ncbi:hypothetical protein GCM10009682_04190 [Luedemannella flava]|uniref:Flp family type IVb pilin n=1 Tax=Luedemannella flava TaxID=349316 RepID=A0ABN2LDU0_9ACTN
MKKLQARLRTPIARRDKGASAVEYGLLVALIAVVIAGAVYLLGDTLSDRFNTVQQCVAKNAPSANC